MRRPRLGGLTGLPAVAAIIITVVAASLMVYVYTHHAVEKAGSEASGAPLCKVKIDAVSVGEGFIVVYARGLECSLKIDRIYVQDINGNTVGYIPVVPPVTLRPGETRAIIAPLTLLQSPRGNVSLPERVRISLASGSGVTAPALLEGDVHRLTVSATIGLLASRGVSCSVGDLRVDPARIHWVYINLVNGMYKFKYVGGSTVRVASGKALIFTNDTLDLSKMSWSQRYRLGPVVVMLNPYRATRTYTVQVINIRGGVARYTLAPLASDENQVVYDAVLLWEDLWWPGTRASLDNYIDHVVRVTFFTNSTVRLEVLHMSGCYLHMLIYRPGGPPPFDTVPSIVRQYMSNSYRLPASAGVVYVKSHGAWAPPISSNKIWDPVNGAWVTSWPPVFYTRPRSNTRLSPPLRGNS